MRTLMIVTLAAVLSGCYPLAYAMKQHKERRAEARREKCIANALRAYGHGKINADEELFLATGCNTLYQMETGRRRVHRREDL